MTTTEALKARSQVKSTDLSTTTQASPATAFLKAVAVGGLLSGTLDAIDGTIAFGFLGMNPIEVLQYIASGAFGASAFQGGLITAAAGAGFHYLIAFVAAAVYVFAAHDLPVLRVRWLSSGFLYGAVVWGVMNFVVLPLSAVTPVPLSVPLVLNGIIGHGLFVGVSIAYVTRNSRIGHAR
jgi:hypothetical protein